jgi:hypothetical protein
MSIEKKSTSCPEKEEELPLHKQRVIKRPPPCKRKDPRKQFTAKDDPRRQGPR